MALVESNQSFVVLEDAATGTLVGTVASSGDTGDQFSIVGGDGAFAIDPDSGTLSVADRSFLDFERRQTYAVTVRRTGDTNLSEAVVAINLQNVYEADLRVTKTDGVSTVHEGDTVTYTIVVTNTGDSDMIAASVRDPLTGLQDVSVTDIVTTAGSGLSLGNYSAAVRFATDIDFGTSRNSIDRDFFDTRIDLADNLNGTSSLAFWIHTDQVRSNLPIQSPAITGWIGRREADGNSYPSLGNDDIVWGWIDRDGKISLSEFGRSATSGTSINDDAWHHVVLTRDALSGAMQVFVDGNLDAVAASQGSLDVRTVVWLGDGTGRFRNQPQAYAIPGYPGLGSNTPYRLVAGDLSGDGRVDIAAALQDRFEWYDNQGEGQLKIDQAISSSESQPRAIAIGDVDGDGDLDIALGDQSSNGNSQVLLNDGSVAVSLAGAADVAVGDLDGDGDLDLFSATASSVLFNADAPTLTLPQALSTPEETTLSIPGIAIADIDSTQFTVVLTFDLSWGTLTLDNETSDSLTRSGDLSSLNILLQTLQVHPAANVTGALPIGITVSDGLLKTADTITISDADTTEMTVTVSTADGVVSLDKQQSDSFVLTGLASELTTQLTELTFLPAFNLDQDATIRVVVDDGPHSITRTIPIAITPVNDPPAIRIRSSGALKMFEDETYDLGGFIFVNDYDGDLLTLTITADHGKVTLGSNTAPSITTTDSDAGLQSLLDALSFTPQGDYTGEAIVAFTLTDGIETTTGQISFLIADDGKPDVNDTPTVSIHRFVSLLSEAADVSSRILVGEVVIDDDIYGDNTVALVGDDAALFEFDGSELYLSAGVQLDYETNPTLDVAVAVNDPTIGFDPDAVDYLSITVGGDPGFSFNVVDAGLDPRVTLNTFTFAAGSSTPSSFGLEVRGQAFGGTNPEILNISDIGDLAIIDDDGSFSSSAFNMTPGSFQATVVAVPESSSLALVLIAMCTGTGVLVCKGYQNLQLPR